MTYTQEGWGTFREMGWTLDKLKGFLVHLPSRVDSLGGNLVNALLNLYESISIHNPCINSLFKNTNLWQNVQCTMLWFQLKLKN